MNSCMCVVLLTLVGIESTSAGGGGPWTYDAGANGIEHWPSLYESCSGPRQSPINIDTNLVVLDTSLEEFNFTPFDTAGGVTTRLINDGYTVKMTYPRGVLSLHAPGLAGDSVYNLANIHFHWGSTNEAGSEHTIDGRSFPMEMHLVTWKSDYGSLEKAMAYPDGLAVLGFLFEIQRFDNPGFSEIRSALSGIRYPEEEEEIDPFPLLQLLPDMSRYYRYEGGLTTPPCSEVVQWTVFNKTIEISEYQVRGFRNLKSATLDQSGLYKPLVDNFRPPQPLSLRKVTANFSPV